jgi:predicted dehydrogenase
MLGMTSQLNRRSFIVTTGMTALAATRVLGANDTVRVGAIGVGGRMNYLIECADKVGGYQLVAVSDVYGPHRDAVKQRPSGAAVTTHANYHEVLEQQLDAVLIAAPDHWHVRMAVDAIAAGKDVYLEKPVTHTLEEGAVLTKAVHSSKQILQCGMQQRSWSHFRDAVDLIQGGSLGRVPQVRTYWWQNYLAHGVRKPFDTQARRRPRSGVQRRKVLSLALVLEFWGRRDDRSLHALDRRGALGDEIRHAEGRADAWR